MSDPWTVLGWLLLCAAAGAVPALVLHGVQLWLDERAVNRELRRREKGDWQS